MEAHAFWGGEPVGLGGDDAPISGRRRTEAETPPAGYRFATLAVPEEVGALVALLDGHYVGSAEGDAVLSYGEAFLRWRLGGPGHRPGYACALRHGEALVGFVLAREQCVVVRGRELRLVGVNFLCLHGDHRGRGLAPLLVKEITRRVHCEDISVAVFTGGEPFFFSFARVQYLHRPINVGKLVSLGFVPPHLGRLGRFAVRPPRRGLRLMEAGDVDALHRLYAGECRHYDVFEKLGREAFAYALLPREGVVSTYVSGEEFVSFFVVTTRHPGGGEGITTAYLHYYATPDVEGLVEDLVGVLAALGVDLLNLLALGRNGVLVDHPAYLGGTGHLSYSFYNFKTERVDPARLFFVMH